MSKVRKPQQARARETVRAIIKAGLIATQRYGVEGTTTRKIADIAGIGVGSLYEYFENKDAVFNAIHEHVISEIVATVKPLIPELVNLPARAAVRKLLYRYRDFLHSEDGLYLHYAARLGHSAPAQTLRPLNHVLTELSVQFLLAHPEMARMPNMPVATYIFIHGGVATLIKHLSEPHPPFEFDALCEGLADMVNDTIEGSLQRNSATSSEGA